MATTLRSSMLSWPNVVPVLAILTLVGTWGRDPGAVLVAVVALLLGAAVLAAVHHAEVVAHRVGEPYGSLVLAVAVTVIEVALIVTLMVSGGDGHRDAGPGHRLRRGDDHHQRHRRAVAAGRGDQAPLVPFNAEGTGAALATVTSLATLSLVLPTFTTARPGPVFSPGQLAFAAIASLALYGMFVLTQTVRHRDFFLPVDLRGRVVEDDGEHAEPPSDRTALISLGLLLAGAGRGGRAGQGGVPGDRGRRWRAAGFPQSFVGVVIALLVLLPGDAGRGAGRDAGPDPDQHEPGPRLGHGQHRADHPGHRGRLDLAGRARWRSGWAPPSWCCSR